jgi:voltage-gated potassium channel
VARVPAHATFLQQLWRRLAVPLTLLAVTHVIGTVGFWWVWREHNATLFDGLFMTFITVTTVGYDQLYPLDTAGRILAMVVAAGGIGTAGYTLGSLIDLLVNNQSVDERRRLKMQKEIDALHHHFVLAGMGRVGREAAEELTEAGVKFVVVDPSEEAMKIAEEQRWLHVKGDATDDDVLLRAGITRAKGLIVTAASDATNLYVIFTSRMLNPHLFIASRAVDNASVPKLMRAGANRAISPYAIGGRRLAHLMLSPRVVDFFETALRNGDKSLNIGDLSVAPGAKADGQALASLRIPQNAGATVLAVLRGGETITTPHGDLVLKASDRVLALGTTDQLEKLELMLSPAA